MTNIDIQISDNETATRFIWGYVKGMFERRDFYAKRAGTFNAAWDYSQAIVAIREAGAYDVAAQLLSAVIENFYGDPKDILPYELSELMNAVKIDGREEFGVMGVHYAYAALQDDLY